MLNLLFAVGYIVGVNVLAFGTMIAVAKYQDFKDFKVVAQSNAEALHKYRVTYGANF